MRMCLDCKTITGLPILTHAVERMSGPPWLAYCCPDCAPAHLDQPRAMEMLAYHCTTCETCSQPDNICPRGRALVHVHSRILSRAAKSPT